MVRPTLDPIETACGLVQEELSQLSAECDAFESFAGRVAEVDAPAPAPATAGPASVGVVVSSRPSVESLRTAYRETVMAVDHYDRVYDETLREHAHAELGADAATLLCSESFVPGSRPILATAAREAVRGRETLRTHLRSELDSLRTAESTLADVLTALDAPANERDSDALRAACESVAADRQERINADPSATVDGHDLRAYLYADAETDWRYPILTVVAEIRAALTPHSQH